MGLLYPFNYENKPFVRGELYADFSSMSRRLTDKSSVCEYNILWWGWGLNFVQVLNCE